MFTAPEGHLMRSAHISHHCSAICPFTSAWPGGIISLNGGSAVGVAHSRQYPYPPGESDGARNCGQPGGYRRQGPGLVALRPRVPGLACVARRRRPALCATSQVKPAEGSARQGHGRPSRPDPAGGSAPVTGLALRPAGAIQRVTLFLHVRTCCSFSPDCRAEPTSLSGFGGPAGPGGPPAPSSPRRVAGAAAPFPRGHAHPRRHPMAPPGGPAAGHRPVPAPSAGGPPGPPKGRQRAAGSLGNAGLRAKVARYPVRCSAFRCAPLKTHLNLMTANAR